MEKVKEIITEVVEAWEEADAGASVAFEAVVGGNARAEAVVDGNAWAEAVVGGNVWAEAFAGGSTGESTLEAQVRQLLLDAEEAPETAGPVYPHTIFRPAVSMYEVNPQAFRPQLVSIGPYYHHMDSLRPMLKHKFRFYLRLLGKLYGSTDIHNNVIKTTVDNLVNRSKKCYFDGVGPNYSDSDFSLMMVLDGCFIIELFRYQTQNNVDDPVFGTKWMIAAIRVDLIKIGNQLPFFVLQALYDVTKSDREPPLAQVAASFFAPLLRADKNHMPSVDGDMEHTHLLALFHSTFAPVTNTTTHASAPNSEPLMRETIGGELNASNTHVSVPDGEFSEDETIGGMRSASDAHISVTVSAHDGDLSEQETIGIPERTFGTHVPAPDGFSRQQIISCLVSASDLRYYRIYIKKGNSDLLNVKSKKLWSKIEIEVPSLLIDLHTGPVLLNLVAHEQSNKSISSYFMFYIVFLIGLVNSDKDVKLLRSSNVFIPEMLISDREVHLQLLPNLSRGIDLAPEVGISYLSATINAINARKKLPLAAFKARLRFIYNKLTILKALPIIFSALQAIIVFIVILWIETAAPARTAS